MRLLRPRRKPRAQTPNRRVHLVVGLANPGPKYEGTRHNVGFEVLSRVLERADVSLRKAPSRLRSTLAQVSVGENRVFYLVPSTFMNESGGPVRAALDFHGIESADLLVIHDDIDLDFGRLRVQVGGGSGGHNGVRSLENGLGARDFTRLKVGVGRPPRSMDPADFVLRAFSKKERPEADLMVEDAADVVEMWVADRAKAQEAAALRARG